MGHDFSQRPHLLCAMCNWGVAIRHFFYPINGIHFADPPPPPGQLRPPKGKALLVHTGSQILAEPEAVTGDVFVVTSRYCEKDLIRVGVVYTTLDRPEREVVNGLHEVV